EDSLGVLLEPDVKFLELLDFSRIDEIIDSGYVATKRKIGAIKERIAREVTPAEVSLKRSIFKSHFPPLLFQNINPIGLKPRQASYVSLLLKQEADVLTLSQLKPNYFRLIADDKISSVYPRCRFNPGSGYFDIFLDVVPAKDLTVSIGGNIASSAATQAFLGVRYKHLNNYSWTFSGNFYMGSFYNSIALKARLEYPTDLPFFADFEGVINSWDYFSTSRYFVGDKSPSFLVRKDNNLRFSFGVPVSSNSKMALDLVLSDLTDSYYHTNAFTRRDTSDATVFSNFSLGLFVQKNTLNRKNMATEGESYLASLRYISGLEGYTPGSTSLYSKPFYDQHRLVQLHLKYRRYFEPFKSITTGVYGEALFSSRRLFSNYMASKIEAPGFSPLPQSDLLFIPEYRGYNWLGMGVVGIVKIWSFFELRSDLFTFIPYREIIEVEDQLPAMSSPFHSQYLGGALSLIFNNSFVPVNLSVSYYPKTEESLQFLVNIGYLIFNKSSHF
ncbi:MAG: hypothetical protein CSA04_03945, partial [Bacteroidetes bacterium]